MTDRAIFVGSVAPDLEPIQAAVRNVIARLGGYRPVRRGDFPEGAWKDAAFRRVQIGRCGAFVGLVGHLRGETAPGTEETLAEAEYAAASLAGVPRIVYLAPEDFPIPANLIEPDARRARQRAFRERVQQSGPWKTLPPPEALVEQLVSDLRAAAPDPAAAQLEEQPRTEAPARGLAAERPFVLQGFAGRGAEREALTEWWMGGTGTPLLAILGRAGAGKSSLAWAWLQRDLMGRPLMRPMPDSPPTKAGVGPNQRPSAAFWWSFGEGEAGFRPMAMAALTHLSGLAVNPGTPIYDVVEAVASLLRQNRMLLVLDNADREMTGWAGPADTREADEAGAERPPAERGCLEPCFGHLLRRMAAPGAAGRLLITSRRAPREIDGRPGARRMELGGLEPKDAAAFFKGQGIRGAWAEMQAACRQAACHPLSLLLLAGAIARDKWAPRDIRAANKFINLARLRGQTQMDALAAALESVEHMKGSLLSRLAAFRTPVPRGAAQVFNLFRGDMEFDQALEELTSRGLLAFDRDHSRYDIHPAVRARAYARLENKPAAHERLRDLYAGAPPPAEVRSVADLSPLVEQFYHTLRAGRRDEAFDLFKERLYVPLCVHLGDRASCFEMLRTLLDNETGGTTPLRDAGAREEAFALFAGMAGDLGLTELAANALAQAVEDGSRLGQGESLAVNLIELAHRQTLLGRLVAAEVSLRRGLELSQGLGMPAMQRAARLELGRLFILTGDAAQAEEELRSAAPTKSDDSAAMAYGAALLLLQGEPAQAEAMAIRARNAALESGQGRSAALAMRVRGQAVLADATREPQPSRERLEEAEALFVEAVTETRRLGLADQEPQPLVGAAQARLAAGQRDGAMAAAQEAEEIAEARGLRQAQAEAMVVLGELALAEDNADVATEMALAAREIALCDGPPYCLKRPLDAANALLGKIGAGKT